MRQGDKGGVNSPNVSVQTVARMAWDQVFAMASSVPSNHKASTLMLSTREEEFMTADIDRIVSVCANAGYAISREVAQVAYEFWSEEAYCASWLSMDGLTNQEVLGAVLEYTRPADG